MILALFRAPWRRNNSLFFSVLVALVLLLVVVYLDLYVFSPSFFFSLFLFRFRSKSHYRQSVIVALEQVSTDKLSEPVSQPTGPSPLCYVYFFNFNSISNHFVVQKREKRERERDHKGYKEGVQRITFDSMRWNDTDTSEGSLEWRACV
eukprot:gene9852-6924_t